MSTTSIFCISFQKKTAAQLSNSFVLMQGYIACVSMLVLFVTSHIHALLPPISPLGPHGVVHATWVSEIQGPILGPPTLPKGSKGSLKLRKWQEAKTQGCEGTEQCQKTWKGVVCCWSMLRNDCRRVGVLGHRRPGMPGLGPNGWQEPVKTRDLSEIAPVERWGRDPLQVPECPPKVPSLPALVHSWRLWRWPLWSFSAGVNISL